MIDNGPFLSFQGRRSSASSFRASLLQSISGVMSLALCPQVVSQAPQHFRASKTSNLWRLLCLPVYLLSHFPSLRHVQGSTPTGVFEGGCRPWTHSSLGLPFQCPCFTLCSKLIEFVRMMAYVVWLSPLEAVSIERGWLLPLPLSSWRLRLYRLHCLQEWWSQLVWRWSPTVTGLWWLSHQGTLWGLAVFLCEKLDLRFHFSCWPFSTVLSHVFWWECLIKMVESVWVPFPLLGLLEFCQLAYLQCLPHNNSHISFRLGVQTKFTLIVADVSDQWPLPICDFPIFSLAICHAVTCCLSWCISPNFLE